ncbi:MAG: hypothetical protein QN183_10710 [Armatimonadota bacterium]|nr:hypothetical protein [Armatimonadota bacterium]MDR7485460.1 hypothetical protein [Armatimonadota bacterium]MDR7533005.1 hypothetical protein [Armatimonadota bacterium]MDR7536823.1 hypothetical protein [Armatimonadota bacterium]
MTETARVVRWTLLGAGLLTGLALAALATYILYFAWRWHRAAEA